MFALVDANNFYASCERLFRPDLKDQPIIVLSNNDGCVVARSNEAKALGIPMAIPYFQARSLCQTQGVNVFSSNYPLYADLSNRVMQLLEASCPDIEIYSIDEAFLQLSPLPQNHLPWATTCQQTVLRSTGIPVSIGIGKTKTLAKIANHIAKKILRQPVFQLDQPERWLTYIAVEDVWGIGRRWGKKLRGLGIMNAQQLANSPFNFLRKQFNIVVARTAQELNGLSCLQLDPIPAPKKNIVSSKSFGHKQYDQTIIAEALSNHCARACEKLRQQNSLARYLAVSIRTNRFEQKNQYQTYMGMMLPDPSDDTRLMIHYAKKMLQQIYRSGFAYHKAGIMLGDICPNDFKQQALWLNKTSPPSSALMQTLDQINQRFGRNHLRIAAMGHKVGSWQMQANTRSPAYTTRWHDLCKVR